MVVNQTPFYGESGGQLGDVGTISWDKGSARVTDTQKTPSGLFIHHVEIISGTLAKEQEVRLQIDVSRRLRLRANHSATHLLHESLRLVLGDHVAQKGSLVSPDRLRFDFSHQKAVSPDELDQVQQIVNARIRMNSDVATRIMTPDAAIELGKPFAVVPCCVFPELFPERRTKDGDSVRTYVQFIDYLVAKHPDIKLAYLPFKGRNRVVYRL